MVKLTTGRLDESILAMKNLPFIHAYVGESVSTCLEEPHDRQSESARRFPVSRRVETSASASVRSVSWTHA